jgi:hypothetical protein
MSVYVDKKRKQIRTKDKSRNGIFQYDTGLDLGKLKGELTARDRNRIASQTAIEQYNEAVAQDTANYLAAVEAGYDGPKNEIQYIEPELEQGGDVSRALDLYVQANAPLSGSAYANVGRKMTNDRGYDGDMTIAHAGDKFGNIKVDTRYMRPDSAGRAAYGGRVSYGDKYNLPDGTPVSYNMYADVDRDPGGNKKNEIGGSYKNGGFDASGYYSTTQGRDKPQYGIKLGYEKRF